MNRLVNWLYVAFIIAMTAVTGSLAYSTYERANRNYANTEAWQAALDRAKAAANTNYDRALDAMARCIDAEAEVKKLRLANRRWRARSFAATDDDGNTLPSLWLVSNKDFPVVSDSAHFRTKAEAVAEADRRNAAERKKTYPDDTGGEP